MRGLQAGEQCKVYIETPDGKILEAPALTVSVSVDCPEITSFGSNHREFLPTFSKSRIELEVLGNIVWRSQNDWEKTVNERHAHKEWKCDYCNRPNVRENEICKSCGAVRSFVYG